MPAALSTNQPTQTNRRRFLQASLGVVLCTALAATGLWWLSPPDQGAARPQTRLGSAAEAVLLSLDGFSEIGRQARNAHPQLDKSLDQLSELLAQRLGWRGQGDSASFSQALASAIRDDFTEQRLLSVNGWQLSATEVLAASVRAQMILPEANEAETESAAASGPMEAYVAEITNWGPQQSRAGTVPNIQADGAGAFWFDSPDVPRWAQIALDGERLPTEYRGYVIVAGLRDALLQRVINTPGEHVFTVHDDINQRWQEIGRFTVLPGIPAENKLTDTLCHLTRWGPQSAVSGQVPNVQPDGSMGLWIETLCAPPSAKLRFGEHLFPLHFNGKALTTLIPAELIHQAGEHEVSVLDEATNESFALGEFLIRAP